VQLVSLAFNVYNDNLYETLGIFVGPDIKLNTFQAAVQDLHYRDPLYYRLMLDCVHLVKLKPSTELFSKCVVFSIQINGSVNMQAEDKKFVSVRLVYPDGSLHTIFLAISTPQERGATGSLEAVNVALNICGDYSNKLIGITTDGESANTGKSGGLWKLLSDKCKRQILTFWCCAYRSDLAAEALIAAVPELQI